MVITLGKTTEEEDFFRSRQVNFRATPEVYRIAKGRAEEYGLSMSAYVNNVIMQDIGLKFEHPEPFDYILLELRELRREVEALRKELKAR